MAAYGGVVALVIPRASSHALAFLPGAVVGALLLLVTLLLYEQALGPALWFGGGTYVAFLAVHPKIDTAAPLVALLLLLCGELAAWSRDARLPIRRDRQLVWRRALALGALAAGGLAAATLAVALTAVPAAHGLAWTLLGAAAAVAAGATGLLVARR